MNFEKGLTDSSLKRIAKSVKAEIGPELLVSKALISDLALSIENQIEMLMRGSVSLGADEDVALNTAIEIVRGVLQSGAEKLVHNAASEVGIEL